MTEPGEVRYDKRGTTAFISFDRPVAKNAMTWAMYEQLDSALDRAAVDEDLRVAVLRGAGGSFVAGTDIAQFARFEAAEDGVEYERQLEAVVGKLESLRLPTIAVVEGHAVGGGFALAAVCDLRLCTPDARFAVPIARTVGNCLSMANYARLVMHLGVSRTKRLMLLADFMAADEARAAGFVLDVVQPGALDARVSDLCARLASHAPVTMRVSKEAIRRIINSLVAEGDDLTLRAYGSRDFHEGATAFVEKRAPRWEGR